MRRGKKIFAVLAILAIGIVAGALMILLQMRTTNYGARLPRNLVATLMAKAEKGDSSAAWQLVSHFEYGMEDRNNADYWLERAAQLGNGQAQVRLYYTYQKSSDPELRKRAISYLTRAAEQDDDAQLTLARMYFVGNGITKDFGLGEAWLRRAAKSDNAQALNDLSYLVLVFKESNVATLADAYLWANRVVRTAKGSIYADNAKTKMAFIIERARRLGISEREFLRRADELSRERMTSAVHKGG